MADALSRWTVDARVATVEIEALGRELTALSDTALPWPEPATVARLVHAAALTEAVSFLEHGGSDPQHEAAVSTSLLKVYLREIRDIDIGQYLQTVPSRIARSAAQLGTDPAECANELTFTAAMGMTALRQRHRVPPL